MSRFLAQPLLGLLALTALACAVATPARAQAGGPGVRALWVAPTLRLDAIDAVVTGARAATFNTLVFDGGGPEALATRADAADVLGALVSRAHAAGLRLVLAFDVLRAAGPHEIPSARDHAMYRHPEWLMVSRPLASALLRVDVRSPEYVGTLLRRAREDGGSVYLSPLQEAAAAGIVQRVHDLVARYAVDGVHLAGLALPDAEYDYSPATVEQFRATIRPTLDEAARRAIDAHQDIDPFAYPVALPGPWRDFRAQRLSTLVGELRASIRAARPEATVSLAVSVEADPTATGHDWRAWIASGFADVVCATVDATGEAMGAAVSALTAAAAPRPFWARVSADPLAPAEALARIAAAGRSGAAGVIVDSPDVLVSPATAGDALSAMGHALLRSSSQP